MKRSTIKHVVLALGFLSSSLSPLNAQSQLNPGIPGLSLDANAGAAPQTGAAYAIPTAVNTITWITSFASAPGSQTTVLQFSNDNSVWVTGDTTTSTAGESRTVFSAARFVRAVESARSGGGAITVSIIAKSSPVTNTAISSLSDISANSITLASATSPVVIPNNTYYKGKDSTGTNNINLWKINTSSQIETDGIVVAPSGFSTGTSGFFSVTNRGFFEAQAANVWRLSNAAGTSRLYLPVTAPSVSVGFCTSPTITHGTSSSFQMDVGSACATGTGTIAIGASSDNGWHCTVVNLTNSATEYTVQSVSSTSSASFTNYARTTGLAANWVAGDDLSISCVGR